jgi:replication-associated recombination protein RarA
MSDIMKKITVEYISKDDLRKIGLTAVAEKEIVVFNVLSARIVASREKILDLQSLTLDALRSEIEKIFTEVERELDERAKIIDQATKIIRELAEKNGYSVEYVLV